MIIHYPEQSWIIKVGFLIHLYFTRSHNLLRKSYESLYASHVRARKKPKFHYPSIIWQRIIRGKVEHSDWSRIHNSKRKILSFSNYEEEEEEERCYARTGLTSQFPLWKLYEFISNSTFVYILFKAILPSKAIGLLLPGNRTLKKDCILPGYFVVYHPLHEHFAVSLSLFHLVWRIYQWKAQRKFKLSFFMFMIQSDKEIEKVLNVNGREYSKSIEWDTSDCFFEQDDDNDDDDGDYYYCYHHSEDDGGEGGEGEEEEDELARISKEEKLTSYNNSAFKCYDDFLKYIMYYPVKYDTRIIYKLRPNRTKEARSELIRETIKFYKVSFIIFGILFWIIFPIALYVTLSDLCYVENYPGCWDFLENLHKQGKLDYLTWHLAGPKLYSGTVDGFVNFVTWIDSGVAVVFVIPIAYLLNYDILLYWRHLQAKLENVLHELKVDWSLSTSSNQFDVAASTTKEKFNYFEKKNEHSIACYKKFIDDSHCLSNDTLKHMTTLEMDEQNYLSNDLEEDNYSASWIKIRNRTATIASCYEELRKCAKSKSLRPQIKMDNVDGNKEKLAINLYKNKYDKLFAKNREILTAGNTSEQLKFQSIVNRVSSRAEELENLIYVLQAELADFFKQIEQVDVIVSDVLSAAFLIWFSTFALITYSTLTKSMVGNPYGIRFIQAIGFSAISVTSLMLLTLNHHTNKSYETICSIMAYDRSKFKKQFLKIIEFYTKRNCSSYTLFHSYPFLATTYLTAVAWNFSCATIVENLSMRT